MNGDCAVILAAGVSKRMGNINKLLIPIGHKPMVRHVVSTYIAAGIEQIIVVVGYQQSLICEALTGLNVQIVFNPNFEEGQLTSIRCGLNAVSQDSKNVLIGLSDQPLLTSYDIEYLLNQFSQQSSKTILVPYYQGQRGNPILLTTEQATKVDNDGIHLGCRKLIDKHPEKVFTLNVSHNHYHCDLDTTTDVTQILGKTAIQEVTF